MNTVIVIGNGFDIDLGWNTSYKDFYDSKNGWDTFKSEEEHDLFQYVIHHAAENWFDFEKTLHDYGKLQSKAKDISPDLIEKDKQSFYDIGKELAAFIQKQSQKPVSEYSFAYGLLETYIKVYKYQKERERDKGSLPKLFSFNYTDIEGVAKQIDPKFPFSYTPVHGAFNKGCFIFGILDDMEIPKDYRFLQKSNDDDYSSCGILNALKDADNIIFFGLSMGYIDSIYFKNLFESISVVQDADSRKNKKITFITRDKETKRQIKNNLQDIGISPQILSNTSDVDVILTRDDDRVQHVDKFNRLLATL